MKVRPNRIGEEIKKELVLLIRNGIKDPRVDSLISITDVEVTGDLSYATIYISRYGSEKQRQDALDGMKAAAGFMRSELSKRLKLRTVPELIFKLDDSLEYGARIENILHQIKRDETQES
jgi:ribosome-binding factor A